MRMPRQHEVLRHAHADGSQNLPATDDPTPNVMQTHLVECGEGQIGALRERARQNLERTARELECQELTPVDLDIKGPALEAGHAFVVIAGETHDALIEHRRRAEEMFRELRHFKVENRLYRSAFYVDSRILALSFLLLLITGEAFLNAKLFAAADPLGLLGGSLQAIIISILNVLPSFLVGLLVLRNLNHVRLWRRLVAVSVLLPYVATIIGYNLLVAHYRVALGTDPEHALATAAPSLIAHPLLIATNLEAMILFGIGLFAACCAAIDGYTLFDDRYPGYGKIDRRFHMAKTTYEQRRTQFRRDIEGTVLGARREIDRRLKKLQKKVNTAERIITKGMICLSRTEQEGEDVARTCERLLRVYREENRKVRTTRAPAHFENYPVLQTNLGLTVEKFLQKKRGMHEALAAKMREAEEVRARLRQRAEEVIAGLSHPITDVEGEPAHERPLTRYLEAATA